MPSRRAFLGGLVLGPASITASASVVVKDSPQGALAFDPPICCSCANMQEIPSRYHFDTPQAWVTYVTTKQIITCPNCETTMSVIFARRTA